jgi:probable DNA metabolism protein
MIFVFDGSLEGFFCTVFEAYRMGIEPVAIYSQNYDYQTGMLYQTAEIKTDFIQAERVVTGIKRISYNALEDIYTAFRHCDVNKDLAIFRFIKLLFFKKSAALSMLNHPDVVTFNRLRHNVEIETHRMNGFLRFRETDFGIYYAPISPDHDILDMLAAHFTDRYKNMPFCIHDVKRQKMLAYDGVICKIVPAKEIEIALSEQEIAMQSIWKDYYQSVNIEERKNERLQRQFLPMRYRKFLTEINNDIKRA